MPKLNQAAFRKFIEDDVQETCSVVSTQDVIDAIMFWANIAYNQGVQDTMIESAQKAVENAQKLLQSSVKKQISSVLTDFFFFKENELEQWFSSYHVPGFDDTRTPSEIITSGAGEQLLAHVQALAAVIKGS